MELLRSFEILLASLSSIAKLALESISVLCVLIGLFKTVQLALRVWFRQRKLENYPFNQLRLLFGSWLALALEFQLGADILATTVAPGLEDLGRLVVVALVRTFLNYFLGKELEAEMELENRKHEQTLKLAEEYGDRTL